MQSLDAAGGGAIPPGGHRRRRRRHRRLITVALVILLAPVALLVLAESLLYHALQTLDVDLGERPRVTTQSESSGQAMDVGILGVVNDRLVSVMSMHLAADRRSAIVTFLPDSRVPGLSAWEESMPVTPTEDALLDAARTIERATGERLEHLAVFDWKAVEQLIERLGGGVDLNVGPEGADRRWPEWIRLEAASVAEFVDRDRCPGADRPGRAEAARLRRQSVLLDTAMEQTLHQELVVDVGHLYLALRALAGNLAVDRAWTRADLRELVFSLRHLRSRAITYVVASGTHSRNASSAAETRGRLAC